MLLPPYRDGGQAQFIDHPVPTQAAASTALTRAWALKHLDRPADSRVARRFCARAVSRGAACYAIAVDARGIALIAGLEIAPDGAEAAELAAAVSIACMERGLIVGGLRPGSVTGTRCTSHRR
jgi:hypothetical protein